MDINISDILGTCTVYINCSSSKFRKKIFKKNIFNFFNTGLWNIHTWIWRIHFDHSVLPYSFIWIICSSLLVLVFIFSPLFDSILNRIETFFNFLDKIKKNSMDKKSSSREDTKEEKKEVGFSTKSTDVSMHLPSVCQWSLHSVPFFSPTLDE